MANSPQAIKRARQGKNRALHNSSLRSAMRTSIKKLQKLLAGGDKTAIQSAFRDSTKSIDQLSAKGLLHKNTAARMKSRLNKKAKSA